MTVSFPFWSVTSCHFGSHRWLKAPSKTGQTSQLNYTFVSCPLAQLPHNLLVARLICIQTLQPPQTPSSVFFKGSVAQLQWLGISFWLGRQPASLSTWDCCHHPTSWYCHFFSIKESSPSCWVLVNGCSGKPRCRWPYSKGKPICRSCATMHRKWLVCPLFCCGSWLPWLCFTILVSLPWIPCDTKLYFPQTSKWM